MSEPQSILLFGAGLGTRMGPLVADKPKPLVKVAGQTLLDRTIALTQVPQISTRVVNVHYKADMIRDHLRDQPFLISDETDQLRETGGGLRHALHLLGSGPVLTLNTDAVWAGDNPVAQILSAWRPDMDGLLMVVPQDQTRGHKGSGDFHIDNDGKLSRGRGPIYSGLQIIRPAVLEGIEDSCFSMNVVWDILIARGTLYGIAYDGGWCDVGQPESIPLAETMLKDAAHV